MKNTKSFRYTDEAKTRNIDTLSKPAVSVSVLIFSINNDEFELILVQRVRDPFKGFWSVPGDLIYVDESLKDATRRVLYEKTGIKNVYLEQVHAFGAIDRDPRGRVITIAYFALLPRTNADLTKAPNALHASWVPVGKLPPLAFDHKKIITMTLEKIKTELAYTNLAKGLLPDSFRLFDLQKVYEIIGGEKLDKRNFRKKRLTTGLIKPTGKMYKEGKHRPAKLYSFIKND